MIRTSTTPFVQARERTTALLYVGAVVPASPEYWNDATSRAGNLFQTNFLNALARSPLSPTDVLCYRPMPSYPRGPLLSLGSKAVAAGRDVRFLPMINLGPLKILSVGLSAAWNVLRWAISKRSVDQRIVLAYNLNCPPAWPLLAACRLTRTKLVAFIGDIYVPGEVIPNTWSRQVEYGLQLDAVKKLDGLLVANWAIRDDLAPGKNAMLVEGGVPTVYLERFGPRMAREGDLHVAFAGALTQLNGLDLLAKALAHAPDLKVRVTIIGAGPLKSLVEDLAARDKRVNYVGAVDHEKVLELYEDVDLLLSLRRTDNQTQRYVFPSKVVECLATARPLLSTLTGHVGSEFGDFCFTIAEETPEALAAKLREIAALPASELGAIGATAQEYVRQNKTWEAHIERLQTYLEDVLA